ncbi:hypothetical protein JQN72_16130 [Phycicoccus sp. CSK15P-2]|uniref:hypothetical protein n=1 Tax=Phycicoccus sp. CSK15P-2 TaxID=2807627 RepID=UPI001950DF59|nr:hypothetical protein [Phycicoccus sp. CSK15P-2]MBM6405772.1 hypothetical protein [Phycicoccus sp. CSK15P-2]
MGHEHAADPHIHVERQVVTRAEGEYRNVLASMLGLAADAPTVVVTGCGVRVPYGHDIHDA